MSNLDKHLMTAKQSKVFATEYLKSNYAEINKIRPANKPDSNRYSIELSLLKEYLEFIDTEMDKKGITNKGVEICMGKYPEDSKDIKLKKEYLGYQMIYFTAKDLSKSSTESKNVANEEDTSAAPGEIPNLNYMNITPPY